MVPTWAISWLVLTFLDRFWMSSITCATALSTPRFRSIGFMPAATAFMPSRTIDCASTQAVVVPSPAMSLVFWAASRTISAPMFSNLSSSSISLATVTPSLVVRGAPNDFSSTTLRPLGPERDLDGVGENVDAAQHALASVAGEFDVFGSHGGLAPKLGNVASWAMCSGQSSVAGGDGRRRALTHDRSPLTAHAFYLLEHPHDVALLHDEELLRHRS